MRSRTAPSPPPIDLRSRAISKLTGRRGSADRPPNASEALRVLHDLAGSASTAADALALLHELQVHQVELDLQAEELRESRVDLEAGLHRQLLLYDHAPVACFTIDQGMVLHELNLAGAALLGLERDALAGGGFERFLDPRSANALRKAMDQVTASHESKACTLRLVCRTEPSPVVQARVGADPDGSAFLIAVMVP